MARSPRYKQPADDPDQADDEKPLHPDRRADREKPRPKGKRGDVDLLIRSAWAQGCDVVPTKKGHFKVLLPDGNGMVLLPGTPSDYRGIRNARSQLRGHGIDPNIRD